MVFTLREANLLSPKTIQNRIVRQLSQMDDAGRLVANDFFPLVELSNSTETFFRRNGIRPGMPATALASESPVGDLESLTRDDVSVDTYKKKIAPEKGVDTELNNEREILNLFNATADALMEDVIMTREILAFREGKQPGMVGQWGQTAHPEIPNDHVITPGTAYDDRANATPTNDFVSAETEISDHGSALEQTDGIGAIVTPRVLKDLKLNDDVAERYRDVRVLSEQQLADEFQLEWLRVIRTRVPRRDADGNYIDEDGNIVDPDDNEVENPYEEVATDNILEPYDPDAGRNVRNIIVGAPGQVSAYMPWFADRLAEHAAGVGPIGDFAVDSTNGFVTQTWTTPDPVVSWTKAMQELGMEVQRGANWSIIQDI